MNIYPILEDILSSSHCFFSPTASTFSSVDTGFSAYLNELVSALLSHQKATVAFSGELDFRVRDAIMVLPFHYEQVSKLRLAKIRLYTSICKTLSEKKVVSHPLQSY